MLKIQDHRVRVAAARREEMRNNLLFSALSLSSTQSIHAIDVDDIIKHAEVSRGSFYKYFPSVSALFQELAEQLAQEVSLAVKETAARRPNTAERLSSTARLIMRLLVDIPALGHLFVQVPWGIQGARLNFFPSIQQDLEQGIKEGQFEKLPVAIGLNLVIGCMVGGVHTMLLKPPSKGYEDKVLRQVLVGLGLDARAADKLSKAHLSYEVMLPQTGILGKLSEHLPLKQ